MNAGTFFTNSAGSTLKISINGGNLLSARATFLEPSVKRGDKGEAGGQKAEEGAEKTPSVKKADCFGSVNFFLLKLTRLSVQDQKGLPFEGIHGLGIPLFWAICENKVSSEIKLG